MDISPLWLLALVAIPVVWVLFNYFYSGSCTSGKLEMFIDKHLIPYLVVNGQDKKRAFWKSFLVWSAVWCCLTLALTGPRWSFRELETYGKDQSLVVLLDLSDSMNAADVKPSRLMRAKQNIQDLIRSSKGLKLGVIAFAADPHMIAPITEDLRTLEYLLPSINTGIVYVQGSKLSPALEMAGAMLQVEPGDNKAVVVMSDGGFEDASAITVAKKLGSQGIVVHAVGIGTKEGAPVANHQGVIVKKKGAPVISKLEGEKLAELTKVGKGLYIEARSPEEILLQMENRALAEKEIGKTTRFWDEGFYLVLFPALPFFLWWFRRGFVIALFLLIPCWQLEALSFKNADCRAMEAFECEDYEQAIATFDDPYRKGVACYRAGKFAEAEKFFQQSKREEVASSAAYNLGNSLVFQGKLKEAITAYENVLKKWPDHIKAKENLELVKKMLEDNQEQNDNNQPQDNEEDNKDDSGEDQSEKESEKDQNSEPNEEPSEDDSQSEEEQDRQQQADMWLNQITNDQEKFLKNKCYIESKKNGTVEGIDPW